jgi:hypothetical protein
VRALSRNAHITVVHQKLHEGRPSEVSRVPLFRQVTGLREKMVASILCKLRVILTSS